MLRKYKTTHEIIQTKKKLKRITKQNNEIANDKITITRQQEKKLLLQKNVIVLL